MSDLNQLLGMPPPQGTRDPETDLIQKLLELANPSAANGVNLSPVPTTAPTPVTPEQPQAAPDLSSLLAEPEKIGLGQRLGAGLSDAIQQWISVKYGRPAPAVSAIDKIRANRERVADRQTRVNIIEERFRRQDVGEGTRQRERGEDITRAGERDNLQFSREKELFGMRNDALLSQNSDGLRRLVAESGGLPQGVDASSMTDDQLLEALSNRRFQVMSQARGEKAALAMQEQERAANLAGLDLLNSFIEGDPDLKLPGMAAWIEQGVSPREIEKKFERRLRIFGIPEESIPGLIYQFRVEFSDEFSKQNPLDEDETPPKRHSTPSSVGVGRIESNRPLGARVGGR